MSRKQTHYKSWKIGPLSFGIVWVYPSGWRFTAQWKKGLRN